MTTPHFLKQSLLGTSIAAAFGLMGSVNALAQSAPAAAAIPGSAASAPTRAADARLSPIVVTGNPLRSPDVAAPVSVLDGDALTLRRGGSLGEMLDGLPGVSSTYFGPNANRPVIRGLDGDRTRILNNSGATIDASSLSYDHAVPIDPLAIERVEVLRGPSALLYGGSAVGGVVNTIDNRIPKNKVQGVSGSAEAQLGGAANERSLGGLVETGNGDFALHVDVFGRETDDLHVPNYTPIVDGVALPETKRLRNSASRTSGGAVGGSWTFDHGYLGLSADSYDSKYGTVVEPDVTIRMKRDHVALGGEVRDLSGPIRTVRARFGSTDYKHEEVEGTGEVGTTFLSKGNDLRVEAEHAPIGPFHGVIGAQFENSEFSALGEEAFVPSTKTRTEALFAVEEAKWAYGTTSFGLRTERAKVQSEGDADPADARFGPAADRRFNLGSASLSHTIPIASAWQVTGTLSATERAPTYYELYANGLHVATSAFEVGDPTLQTERGRNMELALKWKEGASSFRVGAFASRFSRFIALDATGNSINETDEDGNAVSFPEYAFRSVRAKLQGLEFEGTHRLYVQPWAIDVFSKLDLTRGTNLDTGEALARIAPLRFSVGAEASSNGWTGRAEVEHAARQNRVPSTDTPTDGYSMLNLSIAKRLKLAGSDVMLFAKLTNLGNELAYSASSIQTIRGISPLPGRALKVGMKVDF